MLVNDLTMILFINRVSHSTLGLRKKALPMGGVSKNLIYRQMIKLIR